MRRTVKGMLENPAIVGDDHTMGMYQGMAELREVIVDWIPPVDTPEANSIFIQKLRELLNAV